jgi:ABC-type cobalt transport system substrate-binding protein
MKIRAQSTEYRAQTGNKKGSIKTKNYRRGFLAFFLLITCSLSLLSTAPAAKWGGVDESIVEKYAEEYGRAPRDPLINTDQGDLLLFVFLIGGAVGGFFVGYYWRTLTEHRKQNPEHRSHAQERQNA